VVWRLFHQEQHERGHARCGEGGDRHESPPPVAAPAPSAAPTPATVSRAAGASSRRPISAMPTGPSARPSASGETVLPTGNPNTKRARPPARPARCRAGPAGPASAPDPARAPVPASTARAPSPLPPASAAAISRPSPASGAGAPPRRPARPARVAGSAPDPSIAATSASVPCARPGTSAAPPEGNKTSPPARRCRHGCPPSSWTPPVRGRGSRRYRG
jgi:hypothetical protein